MSGSGGGRGDGFPSTPVTPTSVGPTGGTPGGAAPGVDPCDIVQRAPLNSPQPRVIAGLAIGDVLDVALAVSGTRQVLEVRAPTGLAGALTHRGHLAIIQCIQGGRSYKAVVVGKTGGAVEVRIEPA